MADNQKFYDIVKQCKGGLTLLMPSYDSTLPNRTVSIPHNVTQVRVPATFAIGIYVDQNLQRMYEQGYFKVEPEAAFKREVAEIFAPATKPVSVVEDPVVLEALKKGNKVAIKKLMDTSEVNRDNILILARENLGDIPMHMKDYIEQLFGVELTVDGK